MLTMSRACGCTPWGPLDAPGALSTLNALDENFSYINPLLPHPTHIDFHHLE